MVIRYHLDFQRMSLSTNIITTVLWMKDSTTLTAGPKGVMILIDITTTGLYISTTSSAGPNGVRVIILVTTAVLW